MFISTLSSSLQWVATWPKRLHVKHPTGIEMSWKWRKTVGSDAEAPSVSIHVIRTRIVVACDFMDDAQEALLQTKNVRSHCCNVCLKPCVLFLNQQGFKNLQAPLFLSLQVTSGKSAQCFGLWLQTPVVDWRAQWSSVLLCILFLTLRCFCPNVQ